ncbi:MAG: hypothetical protein AAGC92_05045 [Pseudomonadota bacterium]
MYYAPARFAAAGLAGEYDDLRAQMNALILQRPGFEACKGQADRETTAIGGSPDGGSIGGGDGGGDSGGDGGGGN